MICTVPFSSLYCLNRMLLHAMADTLGKSIGKCYNISFTAIILDKLILCGSIFINQTLHMGRIRTPEFIYILIVIAYGNHPHIVIILHQSTYQSKFICIHVLCFINNENTFGNLALLHLAVCNHLSSVVHDIFYTVKTPNLSEQIKAVGMESFDLNKVRGIANQSHKSLFKFGRRCTGKGYHQKLFMLDILQKKQ